MAKSAKIKKVDLGAPEWDLSDLYSGAADPKIKTDLKKCEAMAQAFESRYKGNIKNAFEAEFLAALIDLEAVYELMSKLQVYAGLLRASDTADEIYKALEEEIETQITKVKNHLLFFELEIFELPSGEFSKLLDSPKLKEYRHYLEALNKWKPFHLSLPEERIFNEKQPTSSDALCNLFNDCVGQMEFEIKIGKKKEILQEQQIIDLLRRPDRALRKEAANIFTKTLKRHGWFFADILNSLTKDKKTEDDIRGHRYPEERRHLSNEISKEAVDTLEKAVVENYSLAERYYFLKGKVLGIAELYDYDRYAPFKESSIVVPYAEAKQIVLEAYGRFSPTLASLAREFYEKRWIDAKVRKGKMGGAFCSSFSPNYHPYVLTNYQGSPRDVATEAHELGHGVHAMLARRQHLLDYDTPLTTAETASVFGEMLVFESLKNRVSSDREKLFLIMQKIEDMIATVFRQIAMFRFEKRVHYGFRESGRISEEKLNQWWNEEHQAVFGKSLKLRNEHGCWWMYVPHILHTPFYVYAYAFGELLTLSLYARHKNGEQDFEKKYIELLSAGGSRSPDELLADFGISAEDSSFWQGGIDVMRQLLEEAEALAGKIL